MTGPRLRRARPGDAGSILEIYGPIVRETSISFETEVPTVADMEARVERVNRRVPWLVAERRGDVAGYAYAGTFRAREAYRWTLESSVYVHPGHHRAGVARALMGALVDLCGRQGFRTLVAGATLPNGASEALHLALGFSPAGRFRQVGRKFGRWHDVGFWSLDLGGPEPPQEPGPPPSGEELDALLAGHAASIAP